MPGSFGTLLLVSLTKFQDKFASLQQENSPNSPNMISSKFCGISCVFVNSAGFRRFT